MKTARQVKLSPKPEDWEKIDLIVKRFSTVAKRAEIEIDILSTEMDIVACHLNGCPLDFDKLLTTDDFTLIHDIFGIRNHIDRTTGKISNHFLPRCAKP